MPVTSIATTLGAGSGIDTTALVTSLVSASFDPKDAALKTQETANSAKISSLATLSNGIDSFASALSTLISGGTLKTQPSTSNSAILTATAKTGASIGNLSAQVEVRQLAQAQSLVSNYLPGAAATVGQGNITITAGGTTKTVTIDPTNDSLAGLARAINTSGAGITATVVTDTNGSRLALKGATGAAGAFTITPAADADPALARFAYAAGQTGGMTQAQAAQDAIVRLDGVDVTRASNTVDDLVDGVSLSLVSAQPGTTVSLGATRPSAAISQAVSDFVAAYNELKGEIDTATQSATASSDGTAGALYGNSTIRSMQQQLAKLTSTPLSTSGGYQTLAEIGVSTNRDGTLAVDTNQLNAALANNPDAVEALFNPTQHASSPLIKITSAFGAAKAGTYQLTNIVAGERQHQCLGHDRRQGGDHHGHQALRLLAERRFGAGDRAAGRRRRRDHHGRSGPRRRAAGDPRCAARVQRHAGNALDPAHHREIEPRRPAHQADQRRERLQDAADRSVRDDGHARRRFQGDAELPHAADRCLE